MPEAKLLLFFADTVEVHGGVEVLWKYVEKAAQILPLQTPEESCTPSAAVPHTGSLAHMCHRMCPYSERVSLHPRAQHESAWLGGLAVAKTPTVLIVNKNLRK